MRDKRTPKDVYGEASRELTAAMLKQVVFVGGPDVMEEYRVQWTLGVNLFGFYPT